jgi:hypothetical protein
MIAGYHANMTYAASDRLSRLTMEHGLKPLAIAVFLVLVALLWTFPLQHVIAFPFVFLFFGAVMASAWFGGFIAGAWAIVLSSVLIAFFFMPPLYSIAVNRELKTYYGAFIICAIAITAISAARRRSENKSRVARDDLELRVRERTAELEQSNLETLERERHNAAKLSLHWCARRTLPFTPAVNCKAHWLTEMIHFFAHSLLLILNIRVPIFAGVGSLCSSAIDGFCSRCGNHPTLDQHLACRRLYLQPTPVFDLFGPDPARAWANLALDQRRTPSVVSEARPTPTLD